MSQSNQVATTARHAAIYAVGTVARSLTGFFMLPIYTRFLTPRDYGILELLTGLLDLGAILIGISVTEALIRFYADEDTSEGRNAVASTTLALVTGMAVLGVGLIWLAAPLFSSALFGNQDYTLDVRLFGLTLITMAITQTVMALFRAQQRPVVFVIANIATLVVQVAANVFFVVYLELHVRGVVLASITAGFAVSAVLLPAAIASVGIRISKQRILQLGRFSLPLVAASVLTLTSYYLDRYVLRFSLDLATVGIYALGYKLTFVAKELVSVPILLSWTVQRFEVYKLGERAPQFNSAFKFLFLLCLTCVLCVSLFAGDLLRVMTLPEFWPAAEIVPILAAGAAAQALIPFCDFGILLSNRTGNVANAALIGLAVKGVLLLLLIPIFGVHGAAMAVTLGIFCELAWTQVTARRHFDMGLQWRVAWLSGTAAAGIIVAMNVFTGPGLEGFVLRVGLLLLFLAVTYALPMWTNEERQFLREIVLRPWRFREVMSDIGASGQNVD